jgi:hypothetical protein
MGTCMLCHCVDGLSFHGVQASLRHCHMRKIVCDIICLCCQKNHRQGYFKLDWARFPKHTSSLWDSYQGDRRCILGNVQYGDPGVVNVGPVKNSTGFLFAPLDLSFSARSSKNRDRTIRKVRNPTLDLFFSSPLRWMSRLRTYSRPSA